RTVLAAIFVILLAGPANAVTLEITSGFVQGGFDGSFEEAFAVPGLGTSDGGGITLFHIPVNLSSTAAALAAGHNSFDFTDGTVVAGGVALRFFCDIDGCP